MQTFILMRDKWIRICNRLTQFFSEAFHAWNTLITFVKQ